MPIFLSDILANDTFRKLIISVIVLIVQAVIRHILLSYAINKISDESPHFYTIRKITTYFITIATFILLFGVWIQRLSDLSVALGIFAAGLAFALQEVIGSVAGWITIVTGKPFTIGDRVETGGIRGDVIDIGVLRTTVMEIGNWLDGDHNTGRIVTVSNAFLFKEPLYNYSAHLPFVWDEIKVPITYESDWKRAAEIMTNTVIEHRNYQELLPKAEKQRREVRRKLAVKMTPLEPRTYIKLTDNWIELGLIYPVDAYLRRSFRSEVNQNLLLEYKKAGIVIATQTLVILPNEMPTN